MRVAKRKQLQSDIIIWKSGIIIKMEKKDSKLPSMHKTLYQKNKPSLVKVRSTLASKQKENKLQRSLQQAKAKNFITRAKNFNSPELIFALNDSIRLQTSLLDSDLQPNLLRQQNTNNKTFHNFGQGSRSIHKSKSKLYAINQQRQKAVQLSKWVSEKLSAIKDKKQINLDDVLEYNQTVVNYGLGEIIESVRKRCKQEGDTLKMIWDNTFVLFQNLVNILAQQVKIKDEELVENQKQMHNIFQTNLSFLKNKNNQLSKHLDLLYQKMKKVIIWNRTLRKDRFKQQVQLRVRQYRISSYFSALQEAVNMLLQQSNEPNCLKLAKKIITNLYKQKTKRQKNETKRKKKYLEVEAHEHVHENSKQFVMNWLKKYSLEEQQNIQDVIHLTCDQKIEIINLEDKKQSDQVNIYDFFTAKSKGVQTQLVTVEKSVQFQEKMVPPKVKTIGVETKKIYTSTVGIQIDIEKQLKQKDQKKSNKSTRKVASRNDKKSPLKKKNSISLAANEALEKNMKSLSKLQKSGKLQKSRKSTESRDKGGAETSSVFESERNFKEQWETRNQIFEQNDKISEEQQDFQFNKSANYKSQFDIQDIYKQNLRKEKDAYNKYQLFAHNGGKEVVKRARIIGTQKFITESDQGGMPRGYKVKSLKKKKFEQTYQSQMKKQYQQNKQQMIANVVRRRSFFKINSSRKQQNEKSMILMWSRPIRGFDVKRKLQMNQIDQNIYSFYNSLLKQVSIAQNPSKQKAFNQTCSLFISVSSNLNAQRSIPKNKQFINLSVNGIVKFISRLLFDYLRKIRAQFEGFSTQSQKIYYPLSVILVDHMMHKYGLKEIADKKLRDFMEKMANFVGVSEKLNFFYRLFGVRDQHVCADQLVIYMKCLVYFDVHKMISIMSATKDFSIDRIVTDRETVLANIDLIINQFFPENVRVQVKWKIERYFHIYQLICVFDVERIASMLIEEFLTLKKEQYKNYAPLYKNCQGNIFPNLFKIMQIYCNSEILPAKCSKMLQEIFKNSDLIDENYGKTISQLRFVGVCIKVGFPKYEEICQKMRNIKKQFCSIAQISEKYTPEDQQAILKMKKKQNMKINVEKQAPDYWDWTCAQIGYDIPLINAYSLLGNLKLLQNCLNNPSN